MANQIEVLKQTELLGQQFSVYGTPQEPLFKAQDVAKIIGHTQSSKLVQMVDEDEKLMGTIFLSGQNREVWMLTENGLYEVLMQSRKPIAKEFKRAVKDILKEIRTNGGYIASSVNESPEMIMAKALQVAQATINRHKQQLQILEAEKLHYISEVQELSPKAEYTDKVLQSVNTYTSTQMAKELHLRTGEQLHVKLKLLGVMLRQSGQWLLTAKYSENNYTKSRTHTFTRTDGTQGTNTITVWTESGRKFLHDLQKGGKI